MSDVFFNFKYCYGINSFSKVFQFTDNKKAHLIYAPNGTMKSSFARTMRDICEDRESKDVWFDRTTVREVKYQDESGEAFGKGEILVIDPYQGDFESKKMSSFLADRRLKDEYDDLHNDIDKKFKLVLGSISKLAAKRDNGESIAKDFGESTYRLYDLFELIYDTMDGYYQPSLVQISYGKLFTKEAEEVLSLPEIQRQLTAYFEQYKELVTRSTVFREAFDPSSAISSLESLSKSGFFKAEHQVLLCGDTVGKNEKQYNEIIEAEKKRIVNDELAESYSVIDDMLNRKSGTRDLRAYLYQNKEIIPELANLEEFKKRIWATYLFSSETIFSEAVLSYKRNKARIAEIIELAKAQTSEWHDIVEQFNHRFINLPYSLKVGNKEDVVLKAATPSIEFIVKNSGERKQIDRKLLFDCLSDGERRAYYLLHIIFEITARQKLDTRTLLIVDDIADSFDYKNKYAIIEYLIEIIDSEKFYPIILTHNFDFYRTLCTRAGLKRSSWFAEKSDTKINIYEGEYHEDVFSSWKEQVYDSKAILIASIAFLRNLEQYQNGQNSLGYRQLTYLMHYKKNGSNGIESTERYFVGELCDYMVQEWGLDNQKLNFDRSISAYQFIIETAREIANHPETSFKLEKKLTLAIACRLLTDKYLVNRINNESITDAITGIQTRRLRDLAHFDFTSQIDVVRAKIVDRVLIISSENVHINAFMYEPIIDIALDELKNLFNEVSSKLLSF